MAYRDRTEQTPNAVPQYYGKTLPTGYSHRDTGINTDVVMLADGRYQIDIKGDMLNLAPEDVPILTLLEGMGTESISSPTYVWNDDYESEVWMDIGIDDYRKRLVARGGGGAVPVGSSFFRAQGPAATAPGSASNMQSTVREQDIPKPLSDIDQVGGQLRLYPSRVFKAYNNDSTLKTVLLDSTSEPLSIIASTGDSNLLGDGLDKAYNLLPIDNEGTITMVFKHDSSCQGSGSIMMDKLRNRCMLFGYNVYSKGNIDVFTYNKNKEASVNQMYLAIENATLLVSELGSDGKAIGGEYKLDKAVMLSQVFAHIVAVSIDYANAHVALKVSLNEDASNLDLSEHGVKTTGTVAQGLVYDEASSGADAYGFVLNTQGGAGVNGVLQKAASNQKQKVGVHAALVIGYGYSYYDGSTPLAAHASCPMRDYLGSISRTVLMKNGYNVPNAIPEGDKFNVAGNLLFHRETLNNHTQIFASPAYGISGTAQATKFRFEGDFEKTRNLHLNTYKKMQENAFLFGVKSDTMVISNDSFTSGQPVRTLSGLFDSSLFPIRYLRHRLPNFDTMASDRIIGDSLSTFMRNLADSCTAYRSKDSSKNLTFLAGKNILDKLSRLNAAYASDNLGPSLMGGKVIMNPPSSISFGLPVYSYTLSDVTLNFIHSPAFDWSTSIPFPKYIFGHDLSPRKMLFLVDPTNMTKMTLRPDTIHGNIQEPGRDGFWEAMRGEHSFKARYPKNFAIISLYE